MFWKTSILEADVIKLVVKLTKHWTLKCMVFNSEATFYSFFSPVNEYVFPISIIWWKWVARNQNDLLPGFDLDTMPDMVGEATQTLFFFRIVDGYIVIVLLFQRYTCYILLYCCTMPPTWGIVGTYHVYIIVDSMNVVLYILILRDGISLFHTYIYIYIHVYIYTYIHIYIYSYIV
jgi:hypothetical protein